MSNTNPKTAPRLTAADKTRLWGEVLRYEGKPGVSFIGTNARAILEEDERQDGLGQLIRGELTASEFLAGVFKDSNGQFVR